MSKREKMSFLFISLPWLSNKFLWNINKLKHGLWCTIWLSYIHTYTYTFIFNKTVTNYLIILKKYLLPNLNSTSYPKGDKGNRVVSGVKLQIQIHKFFIAKDCFW